MEKMRSNAKICAEATLTIYYWKCREGQFVKSCIESRIWTCFGYWKWNASQIWTNFRNLKLNGSQIWTIFDNLVLKGIIFLLIYGGPKWIKRFDPKLIVDHIVRFRRKHYKQAVYISKNEPFSDFFFNLLHKPVDMGPNQM